LRRIAVVLLLSAIAAAQTPTQASPEGPKVSPRARQIQNSTIVIDTHEDTPQRFVDEDFDLGTITPVTEGMVDLAKIREANLGAAFFSIWVDPKKFKGEYAHRAFDLIDGVYEQAKRHPDQMVMAFSAEDIERAHQQHKFAALMGVEGGHSIENDIRILRDFYRLGVRYMTLTWSNTNEWADSSGDMGNSPNGVFGASAPPPATQHHNGLTDFGKQVVLEMNRLGMLVDISHVADKTFWDTIEVTKAPVIASHSSSRALASHPRNMTDDMLKAVAKNNGVVMVNFYSGFLSDDFLHAEEAQAKDRTAAVQAAIEQWKQQHPGQQVPYDVGDQVDKKWNAKLQRPAFGILMNHIDHIAKVAGIDHVGLGTDFDGITSSAVGMDSVADLPKITQALLDRGYTEVQIKKILGGNLLRAFRDVERVSREMRGSTPEWSPEKQKQNPTQRTQRTQR
jgi:membrane dipeptidase